MASRWLRCLPGQPPRRRATGGHPGRHRVVGPLPERPVVDLDAGHDHQPCRQVLAERAMVAQIAIRGVPTPIQVGRRWVIERTHAWGNQDGKLRWCTERRRLVVASWLALANAVIVCGRPRLDPLPLEEPTRPTTVTLLARRCQRVDTSGAPSAWRSAR